MRIGNEFYLGEMPFVIESQHKSREIVIGSHGRTDGSRILLGSVAEKVVRRSPVPVTVVR